MTMKKFTLTIFIFFPLILVGQTSVVENIRREINQQNFDRGLEIIDSLMKNKESSNLIYYYKAWCEDGKKDYESSLESATISLSKTNKSDTLYQDILFLRSLSYANAGKVYLGILDNEILVNEFPKNIDYLLNMSYLYGENQQFYNCIKSLSQALTIDSLNIYIIKK